MKFRLIALVIVTTLGVFLSAMDVAAGGAPAPQAGNDFQTVCSASGVIKCVNFDSPADIAGDQNANSGILPGDVLDPVIDYTVAASGGGSLKFTIPANAGPNSSGAYFTNFSTDLSKTFGENSEFYVQWRQRFSPEFLTNAYAGGNGWKQAIIGTGDQANARFFGCTDLEVVTQNTFYRAFAQMYNSCTGSTSHGAFDDFDEHLISGDIKLQNARPSPYCLYSQERTNPVSSFPPTGNCFAYAANEWMTFEVHVKTGPRVNDEFTNSYVQLWIAREGQPAELAINWGPYNLTAGAPIANQKYGKMWLIPYNTNKDSSVSYPEAYTWYDNLVISTQPIAMNGSTPPPAITNVLSANVTNLTATITWTTDQQADSQVLYGTTSSYGQVSTLNSSLVTNHSVTLSALSANTTYHFGVKSSNSANSPTTNADYTFTTAATPSITMLPVTLPPGAVGVAYSQTVTASGGYAPYTYSVLYGALPDGLTLNSATGKITGTPTALGLGIFTVQAVDSAGNTASVSYAVSNSNLISNNILLIVTPESYSAAPLPNFVGQATLNLNLVNTGPAITAPMFFKVTQLQKTFHDQDPNHPDVLLSADNEYGTVGDIQTVSVSSLARNQSVPVHFTVGIGSRQTFTFSVDLYTVLAVSSPSSSEQPTFKAMRNSLASRNTKLGQFRIEVSERALATARVSGLSGGAPSNLGVITGPGPQSRPAIAVDPIVPEHMAVASNDYSSRTVVVKTSQDGGQTWSSTALNNSVNGLTFLAAQDPVLAFDSRGHLSVVYTLSNLEDSANAVVLSESSDLVNFNAPSPITFHISSEQVIDSRPAIAIKPGAGRYVAWDSLSTKTFSYSINVVRSDEGGLFGPVTTVAGNGQFASASLALSASAVYIGWDDWGFNSTAPYKTGGRLMISSSPLGTHLSFTAPKEIAKTGIGFRQKIPAMPERGVAPNLGLATDPAQTGYVYAVFADRGNGMDIRLATSPDSGQTWQPPVTVNNDATMADQFSPAIAMDSDGHLNISFYDTRMSNTLDSADLFLARRSAGNSFDNQRVSSVSSNDSTANPLRDFAANLGDRTAIAMVSDNALIAWTDTRLGNEEIFLSVVESASQNLCGFKFPIRRLRCYTRSN